MILDKIINSKKQMLEDIVKKSNQMHINNTRKSSFYKAMSKEGLSIIGEIKKASPSKGVLIENLDIQQITNMYSKNVDAISVITEEVYFKGKLEYLDSVKKLTNLPILCKDFIIDIRQIDIAFKLGASCVLLIARILEQSKLDEYVDYAHSLDMDVLVEINNYKDLEKVLKTNAKIIGINNRNLRDFSVDLNTTIKLSKEIPSNYLIISESGINKKKDIQLLSQEGKINGILVGESFIKAKDISAHAKELRDGYSS